MQLQSIRLAALIVACLATAAAAEQPASRPATTQAAPGAAVLPKPTGPYAVGRIDIKIKGVPHTDPAKPAPDARLLPIIQVWYPAAAGAQGKPAAWLPPDQERLQEEKGFVSGMLKRPANPIHVDVSAVLKSIVVHAREGVPLADPPKTFPVLLFSAGSQTIPSSYSALVEDLASRGYVVVGYGPTVMGLGVWQDDLPHVLDELKVWNTTQGNLFFNRLNLDCIGAFGHSFGASAVSTVAATDKRLKAIVLIDGGGRPEDGRAIPVLVLKSEGVDRPRPPDPAKEKSLHAYLQKAKPGICIMIKQSVHMSFSDMAAVKAFALEGEGEACLDASRAVIGAFFDQYLLGKPGMFGEGFANYPLVKIESPK